jgi:hypothetical protein
MTVGQSRFDRKVAHHGAYSPTWSHPKGCPTELLVSAKIRKRVFVGKTQEAGGRRTLASVSVSQRRQEHRCHLPFQLVMEGNLTECCVPASSECLTLCSYIYPLLPRRLRRVFHHLRHTNARMHERGCNSVGVGGNAYRLALRPLAMVVF